MPPKPVVSFVSTAFNESLVLPDFCSEILKHFTTDSPFDCNIYIADNFSTDDTLSTLKRLASTDSRIHPYVNSLNRGPEPSVSNMISEAIPCSDFIILLCSDLQDPPDMAIDMLNALYSDVRLDSVIAVKKEGLSNRFKLSAILRSLYYLALTYTSRTSSVPAGFHGFGCYRTQVLDQALNIFCSTDLNLRQSIITSCQAYTIHEYLESPRFSGSSSYGRFGHAKEAFASIKNNDALASRFILAVVSLMIVLVLASISYLIVAILRSDVDVSIAVLVSVLLITSFLQTASLLLLSRRVEHASLNKPRLHVDYKKIV